MADAPYQPRQNYFDFLADTDPNAPERDLPDMSTQTEMPPPPKAGTDSIQAPIPSALLMGGEDPTKFHGFAQGWAREWFSGWSSLSHSHTNDSAIHGIDIDAAVLAYSDPYADTKTHEQTITRLGQDVASHTALTRYLSDRGLSYKGSVLDLQEQVYEKMQREDPEWRTRLGPKDTSELAAIAVMQTAVANSEILPQHRAKFDFDALSSMHTRLQQQRPEYTATLPEFERELGAIDDFIAEASAGPYIIGGSRADPAITKKWYEMIEETPWNGSSLQALPVLHEARKKLRDMRAQGLESAKLKRVGFDVPAEKIVLGAHELSLSESTLSQDVVQKWAFARASGLSFVNPYAQSVPNAYNAMRDMLTTAPEEILGRLWKLADPAQLTADGNTPGAYDRVSDPEAATRRRRFGELDAAIRAEPDPLERQRLLSFALRDPTVINPTQRQAYTDMLNFKQKESVEDQRVLALEIEKRGGLEWNPEVSRQTIDSSQAARASIMQREEKFNEFVANNPLLTTINFVPNFLSFVAENTGMRKLGHMVVHPLADAFYDTVIYEGMSKAERLTVERTGSLGDWVNQKLGTYGAFENWQNRFIDKLIAGQAGYFDYAFMTGAALLSGLGQMPGAMIDSPIENLLVLKAMGKTMKARSALGEAMLKADVHPSLVALTQLVTDPSNPGLAVNTILGRDPAQMRALGVSSRAYRNILGKQYPEFASSWTRWSNDILARAKASGAVTDANLADSAVAMHASLLTRAQAREHIAIREIRDFVHTIEPLGPSFTKSTFAPFRMHGASSNELLKAASYVDEAASLRDMEAGLAREVDGETTRQRRDRVATPAMKFRDVYDAYQNGEYNSIADGLSSVLGWMPKEWINRAAQVMARTIVVGQTLIYDTPIFDEAIRRLQEQRDAAQGHVNLTWFIAHHANLDTAVAEAQHTVDSSIHDFLVRTRERRQASPDFSPEDLVPIDRAIERQAGKIQALTDRFAANSALRDFAEINRTRIEDQALTGATHLGGVQDERLIGKYGLEQGFESNMPEEMQRRVSGALYNAYHADPAAFARMRLPETLAHAVRSAHSVAEPKERNLRTKRNAYNLALAAFARGDINQASHILRGVGKFIGQDPVFFERGIAKFGGEISAELGEIHTEGKELAHQYARQTKGWTLEPLDADLTDVIAQTRARVSTLVSQVGPVADLYQMLIAPVHFAGGGRVMALMAQQKKSQTDAMWESIDRIDEDMNRMPLQLQRLYGQVIRQHPRDWDPNLPELVRDLALRESNARSHIIHLAEQSGVINHSEMTRLLGKGYEDRYYLTRTMRREIEAAGHIVSAEALIATQRLLQSAPLTSFEMASNPDFARVRYRNWRHGGAWEERDFAVRDGKPATASLDAQAWIKEMEDKGELREGEYQSVVPASTKFNEVLRGMVDAKGMFRHDKLKDMYVEVTRRELFAQVANMGGLVRRELHGVNAIPSNRHGEWVKVTGKEWGMLQDQYIHKSIVGMINSWTGYGKVLDSIAADAQESFGKLAKRSTTFGKISEAVGEFKPVKWLDSVFRHDLIIWNHKSWISNMLTNVTSMMAGGMEVFHPSTWRYSQEYDGLVANISETTRRAQADIATGVNSIERQFYEAQREGFGQTASDAPTSSVAAPTELGILQEVRAHKMADTSRDLHKLESLGEAKANADYLLKTGDLTDGQRTNLEHMATVYAEMENTGHTKLLRKMGVFSSQAERLVRLGDAVDNITHGASGQGHNVAPRTIATASEEAFNFTLRPNKSYIRRAAGAAYSQIDSRAKWIFYRALTERQGIPRDAALERVASYMQNYSAVSPKIRVLKDIPLVGSFVPGFAAESLRTGINALTQDAGRIVTLLSRVFAANCASLFVQGQMPSDVSQYRNDKTAYDHMISMFFTLHVPTARGNMMINIAPWSVLGAALNPSGLFKPLAGKLGDAADDSLGVWGIPVRMIANFVTNFVGNQPLLGPSARTTLALDPYKQELVYNKSTVGEMLSGLFLGPNGVGMMMVPSVASSAVRTMLAAKQGPISLITKHNASWTDLATKGLSGLDVRTIPRSEAVARVLLEYGGETLAREMWAEGMGSEVKAYKSTIFRLANTQDPKEKEELTLKANAMAKEMIAPDPTIAGQKVYKKPSDDDIAHKVIRDASADIFTVIDRLPTSVALQALRNLPAGIAKMNDPEMKYLAQTLTNEEFLAGRSEIDYMAGRSNVVDLVDAAKLAQEYASTALTAEKETLYKKVEIAVITQLQNVLENAATDGPERMLKARMSAWPRFRMEAISRKLGLIR